VPEEKFNMKTYDVPGKDAMETIADGQPASDETSDVEESSVKRSGYEESLASAAGAANKADKAVKDTAQRYFKLFGIQVDLDDIEKKIRDRPFLYLALAAGAGFTIGGGLAINMGVALLGIFGRRAAAETTTNFVRQFVHRTVSRSKPQPMMLRH
jgi:hypothetical protein